jgi:hypothetical protein
VIPPEHSKKPKVQDGDVDNDDEEPQAKQDRRTPLTEEKIENQFLETTTNNDENTTYRQGQPPKDPGFMGRPHVDESFTRQSYYEEDDRFSFSGVSASNMTTNSSMTSTENERLKRKLAMMEKRGKIVEEQYKTEVQALTQRNKDLEETIEKLKVLLDEMT